MRRFVALITVTLAACAAHAAYFLFSSGDFFYPDSQTYLIPARHLAAGWGFVDNAMIAETMRTPGYPFFLTAFAPSFSAIAIVVIQHLLAIALGVMLFVAVRRETGRTVAAVVATLLYELDPLTLHYANKVLSETLFSAFLFTLFLLALRARRGPPTLGSTLLLAFLAGGAAMIRPVGLYYIGIVFLWLLATVPARRFATATVFLVAATAMPLGWTMRNYGESGVVTFSSIAGTNLLVHRAAPLLAMHERGEWKATLTRTQDRLVAAADAILARECDCEITSLPHARRGQVFERLATPIIRHYWRDLPRLTWRGALTNLLGTDADAFVVVSGLDPRLIRTSISVLAWLEALMLLAALAVLLRREDRTVALFALATIAYFLLIAAGSEAESRFRLPVLPVILFTAALALRQKKRAGSAPALSSLD